MSKFNFRRKLQITILGHLVRLTIFYEVVNYVSFKTVNQSSNPWDCEILIVSLNLFYAVQIKHESMPSCTRTTDRSNLLDADNPLLFNS